MTDSGNSPKKTNGVGVVALLLLFALMLFISISFFRREAAQPIAVAATETHVGTAPSVLAAVTEKPVHTPLIPTEKPSETATMHPTDTPLPTATETQTSTIMPPATATATQDLVETAVSPPTITPTETKLPPLPTPQGVYSWTLKIPTLMYHYISIPPEDADKYREDLSVPPGSFREQMAYLAENGYETVDFYDLSLAISNKRELPAKPIIITLDDGYRDNYDNAFPILKEYGFTATFFVVTEFIDRGLEQYITWPMAEEMAAAGMRIEPHSKTHADLSGQEYDYILYEMLGSQETIAAHIGYTPRYFCYPGGRYDEKTLEAVADLDFWGAVTTSGGVWHGFNDRFTWSRVRMRNTTTMPVFRELVSLDGTIAGKHVE